MELDVVFDLGGLDLGEKSGSILAHYLCNCNYTNRGQPRTLFLSQAVGGAVQYKKISKSISSLIRLDIYIQLFQSHLAGLDPAQVAIDY